MSIKDIIRSNIKDLMEKYVYAMRNVIVSIFNSSEDLALLEDELKKTIIDLVNGIKNTNGQFSDLSNISLFEQHLTNYTTNLIDIAKAHKVNNSIADLEKKLMQKIESFSDFLFSFNTNDWTKSELYNYLEQFATATKNQMAARKTKNWVEDHAQFKNAYGVFISGISPTFVPFAQYLSDGIIMQIPWMYPLNLNNYHV